MPVYVYECAKGHGSEKFFSVAEMQRNVKCRCGLWASQVIQPVAIHTLATFAKEIDDAVVRKSFDPGDGSYIDPTLSRDRKTGKITRITSRRQRDELMKAKGLSEYGETDLSKDTARLKRTRPFHGGSAGGTKRRAHG